MMTWCDVLELVYHPCVQRSEVISCKRCRNVNQNAVFVWKPVPKFRNECHDMAHHALVPMAMLSWHGQEGPQTLAYTSHYSRFYGKLYRHSLLWDPISNHVMHVFLPMIPKYRYCDIAYCYIIVPNKSQTLCCRCKKASVFQALKLKIYLKYAFNLNLCYYSFVWTPTCFNGACMYTTLSLVFSTNVVCVKTQQKHCSMKHHDKTKQEYKQLKHMIQSQTFLSVPKHHNSYSATCNLLGVLRC